MSPSRQMRRPGRTARPPAGALRGSPASGTPGLTGTAIPVDPLYTLNPRAIWRFVRQQPVSFWACCIYLVFEYVRPQSLYPVIDIVPWTQLTMLTTVAAIVLEGRFPVLKIPLTWGILAFGAVVLLSTAAAFNPAFASKDLSLFGSWVVAYVMIVCAINTERRFLVFLGLFLLASFKMSQHGTRSWVGSGLAFRSWGATGGPGWFHNSGEFGIQMAVFLPMAIYFSIALKPYLRPWVYKATWLLPATAVMSMIATSSRGALVGGGLVAAWMVARSRYRLKAAVGVVVVAAAVWAVTPPESKARFSSAGEDKTSTHRLILWEHGIRMANARPVLGVGYRNFAPYMAATAPDAVDGTNLPHNIFIEAWAELGYTGLFTLLGLMAGTFAVNARTRRMADALGEQGRFLKNSAFGLDGALIGFVGSGFFVTVLYYPYFWINLALTGALQIAAQDSLKQRASSMQRSRPRRRPVPQTSPVGFARPRQNIAG